MSVLVNATSLSALQLKKKSAKSLIIDKAHISLELMVWPGLLTAYRVGGSSDISTSSVRYLLESLISVAWKHNCICIPQRLDYSSKGWRVDRR